MERCENDVPYVSEPSVSVMNSADSRQLVRRRPSGLTIRLREMDCVLDHIQAQIELLQRERTYLRLVRGELGDRDAKPRGLYRATPR